MYRMSDKEFESVVMEAIDTMPARFARALDNVAVVLADEPTDEDLEDAEYEDFGCVDEESGELLGFYDGVALTERGNDYGEFGMDLPDVITVFKGPHERLFEDRATIVEEVKKTVIHEIGHYFGLDEDQLAAMGYE